MSHEQIIKRVSSEVFNTEEKHVELVERLMGGMSNFTYIIRVENDTYTFRIPGKKAEKFVDREQETYHIGLIEPLGLNNETVYLNTETGIKIAKYIEGVPLHEQSPFDHLKEAADVLKTIHHSELKSKYDYDPFGRLTTYENHVKEYNHTHDPKYKDYKATLLKHRPFLDQFEKTLTHGDSQISNFVVTKNGLRLMDWEFTGNNDPFYDIACFGNNDFDHAVALLPVYLKTTPTYDDYKRLYLWRTFQCLQWHNVALYKHYIGLSEDLKVPFDKVANLYLDKAANLLAKL